MTTVQDALFDLKPPRHRKTDNPAYRSSRRYAEAFRDEQLAIWREHQAGCDQCLTAWDRAAAAGRRPFFEVCGKGLIPLEMASRTQSRILQGYYPDRDKPATPGPETAGRNTQEALWTP